MNSTADQKSATANPDPREEYAKQFQSQFNEYLAKQPGIIRGLHLVLKVIALLCIILACVMFVVAMYYTFHWAFTRELAKLGEGWANFGLSMSFLVFPWGLDSMLLRAFPTLPFISRTKLNRPIKLNTGIGGFFAGVGIMCAGAPGAVRFYNLAVEAIQELL